jgi:hypothetical protein
MGMAKLNVFVSRIDDPCGVDDRTWYVTIYECDGNVLEYCGRRYVVLPARCGHLEVEVPPGCYYIKAVWGFTVVRPGLVYRVNHFTDAGIVTACCEQTVCIKLFNPSVHRCGFIYVKALQDLVRQQAIGGDAVERVAGAIEAVDRQLQEKLGPPPKLFELGHHDEIEKLVAKQAQEEG